MNCLFLFIIYQCACVNIVNLCHVSDLYCCCQKILSNTCCCRNCSMELPLSVVANSTSKKHSGKSVSSYLVVDTFNRCSVVSSCAVVMRVHMTLITFM